jgi:protein-S-isoprenylcysteine O-methyltransferase Ste14
MKFHRINPASWDKPNNLLITDVFKYSRNLIYLGMVIFLFGLTIYLGNITAFVAPIFVFIVLDVQIIPIEEKLLEKEFKNTYINYKK